MKARKKRSNWQIFLWGLRHPLLYCRASALCQLRRKRIQREYIDCIMNEYDPEFERWWRKEMREMNRRKKAPDYVYYSTGQRYW